jgi:hypothetical protein
MVRAALDARGDAATFLPHPMQHTDPQRKRSSGMEGPGWLERNESQLTIVGPLAIGIATACYGAISGTLTATGSLVAGWALWQLSLIIVLIWVVANTKDDPENLERMRLGSKPRRPARNRR